MVNYVDLLVGEVLLGDVSNKYLYVGEDQEAQRKAMHSFCRSVVEEGQQLTSTAFASGTIVVNGTQRFTFVNRNQSECVIKGLSFNRIFIDVCCTSSRNRIKQSMFPHLVYHDGDFV
jgi:hypothetical protein